MGAKKLTRCGVKINMYINVNVWQIEWQESGKVIRFGCQGAGG